MGAIRAQSCARFHRQDYLNQGLLMNRMVEGTKLARKPYVIRAGTAVLTVTAAWAVFFFFDPADSSWLPPCPFHALTGLYCPLCGTARALHQMAHGNLPAALRLNALVVCGLVLEVLFALRRKPVRWQAWCRWAVFWTIVAFAVLRNIPMYPFSVLAP